MTDAITEESTFTTGIPESEQTSNFANATLHTASAANGIACSIAVYPAYPSDDMTEAEIAKHLADELAPLIAKGWTFEVQIGPDCDNEA